MGTIVVKKVQYGSLSYKVLLYARFRGRQGDGCFQGHDYLKFKVSPIRPTYLGRSMSSLVRNGHLEVMGKRGYKITPQGVDCLNKLGIAYRETLNVGSRNRGTHATEELKDIQSEDF